MGLSVHCLFLGLKKRKRIKKNEPWAFGFR